MIEKTLGDYVTLQRGNTYKGALLGQPGPVLLGLGAIERDGGFKESKLKTYGGSSDPRMLLSPGDVFVSLKDVTQAGDLLGSVARLPAHIRTGRLTQDTVKLVPKSNAVPLDLIYWTLRTPQYRAFCRAHATGTTNLGLARDDFLSFPIPSLCDERSNLVGLLQSLDDKIELNRKMNATLEAMARALFRDWFVDFGPTRAKMEARAPYLSPDLWSLFPDRLDDEGKPEGWDVRRVDQFMELAYGKALKATDRQPGNVPVYGSGGITGTHSEALVRAPSVIVGRKGTVGSLYWEDRPFFPIDTVFYVRPYVPLTFCFYALEQMGLDHMNTDAAVPGLNRNNVYRLEVAWPGSAIVEAFDAVVSAMRGKIKQNDEESRTLAQTRDLLLPRLMSGELRVADLAPSSQETAA